MLAGCVVFFLPRTALLLSSVVGQPVDVRIDASMLAAASGLDGGRLVASSVLGVMVGSALYTFALLLVLLLLTFVVRRMWIAVALVMILLTWILAPQLAAPALYLPFFVAVQLIYFVLLLRGGLLAHVVGQAVRGVLWVAPLTLQGSAWFAPLGWAVAGIVVLLALYGFRVSLAGRRLLTADPM